jgi:hypothetical protein
MGRLTDRRRAVFAEKAGDLANLSFAALILGQAVGHSRFSIGVALAGLGLWAAFMTGTFLSIGDDK